MTINVNCPPRGLFIGRETENVSRTLTVDFSAWAAEHGPGTLQVLLQRPGDATPYPVTLTVDGTVATWKPSETDLAEAGTGAVQLVYTVGEVRVKTSIIPVMVEPSLGVESDPPEGWTSWIDQLTDLAAETEQHAADAAESAENAAASAAGALQSATDAGSAKNAAVAAAEAAAASVAHYPQIVGGVWYVWSPSAGAYISTGIDAQGEDGVSPTVEITAIQGGHRVVITDAEGPHTFDVLDGVTPDLSAYRTAVEQDVIDDAQDQELNNLKSALNTKAGILRDTVSGSVASFVPDSTIPDLLGLDVALEPIQDLHGYDSPWPAGGGKNLFVFEKWLSDNGVEYTKSGNFYTFQVAVGLFTRPFVFSKTDTEVTLSFESFSNGTSVSARMSLLDSSNSPVRTVYADTTTVKTTGTACKVRMDWQTGGAGTVTIKAPQIELGSTATSYAPYSNICPISGRTGANVFRTGVNVWDEEWEDGYINWTGELSPYKNAIRSKNYCRCKPNTTYYIKVPTGMTGYSIVWYTEDKQFIDRIVNTTNVTAPSNAYFFKLSLYNYKNDGRTEYLHDVSLNYPSTDTVYHEGHIQSIPINWESEAGTVYGGTLDVTNGTLTVDRAMVDLGTLNWSYQSAQNRFYAKCPEALLPTSDRVIASLVCSQYRLIGFKTLTEGKDNAVVAGLQTTDPYITIRDTAYSDAQIFTTAMSGVQLVYELATPIAIQLDPVTISTISGQTNNVWANTGDVSVEFAADLKTYIDNKIAAAVAALS